MTKPTSVFSTPYQIGEELTVPAESLLDLPKDVHLRMVRCDDSQPMRPHGYWPLIVEIERYPHPNTGVEFILLTVAYDPTETLYLLNPSDPVTVTYGRMNLAQERSLRDLCERYKVPFDPNTFFPRFDLPEGFVARQVGPIYVGCDPEGRISS